MTQRPTDHDAADLSSNSPKPVDDAMDNDPVDAVLGRISPRPRASEKARERVHARVLAEFEALPSRRASVWPTAVAACLVGALALSFLGWQIREPSPSEPSIASISYASGEFAVSDNRAEPQESPNGQVVRLSGGSRVVTSEHGRMMLTIGTDTSVRMDVSTQIALRDVGEINLERGRIYVDSHGDESELAVLSKGVRITKVGTQFMLERRGQELALAVREGTVRLGAEGPPIVLTSGSGVAQHVSLRSGRVTHRSQVASDDRETWGWIAQARPDFDTTNASLHDYLSWVARETGRSLSFAAGAEAAAKRERDLVWGAERVGVDDLDVFLRAAAEPLQKVPGADPGLLRVALLRDSRQPHR